MLLEVIVQTVADALAAERGGADRLEVVRDINREGLTPSLDLVRAIAAETTLPLRVMIRESEGFGVLNERELATLQQAFGGVAGLRVDGAVVGFTRDGGLDLASMRAILSRAPALRVTLHRAFDHVRDPFAGIDAALSMPQVDRILTSGGGGSWEARCRRLQQYVTRAGDRLTILAGGGVDDAALERLASARVVREAHVGRAARDPQVPTAPVSADRVRRLKELASCAPRTG